MQLSSENIASSALSVAEKTKTTGYCYAAVCRALRPLGVELSGEAAYQAEDLLKKDPRFMPLCIYSVDELRRGDIIVYTRSSSHKYGHISVYEGNYKEASDHIASITHTQAYGGAMVFRLRNDNSIQADRSNIASLPASSYAQTNRFAEPAGYSPYANVSFPQAPTFPQARQPQNFAANNRIGLIQDIKSDFNKIKRAPLGRSLIRRFAHLILD